MRCEKFSLGIKNAGLMNLTLNNSTLKAPLKLRKQEEEGTGTYNENKKIQVLRVRLTPQREPQISPKTYNVMKHYEMLN